MKVKEMSKEDFGKTFENTPALFTNLNTKQ